MRAEMQGAVSVEGAAHRGTRLGRQGSTVVLETTGRPAFGKVDPTPDFGERASWLGCPVRDQLRTRRVLSCELGASNRGPQGRADRIW